MDAICFFLFLIEMFSPVSYQMANDQVFPRSLQMQVAR